MKASLSIGILTKQNNYRIINAVIVRFYRLVGITINYGACINYATEEVWIRSPEDTLFGGKCLLLYIFSIMSYVGKKESFGDAHVMKHTPKFFFQVWTWRYFGDLRQELAAAI